MNKETEIRVKISDPVKAESLLKEKAKFIAEKKQKDIYFVPKDNDFFKEKPVREFLRVRFEDGRHHLNYSFCNFKDGELLSTEENETLIDDPEKAVLNLEARGFVRKVAVVKVRKYFDFDDFEIVLDHVDGVGDFIEVEAKKDFGGDKQTREECFKVLSRLGIEDYTPCQKMGYPEMVLKGKNL